MTIHVDPELIARTLEQEALEQLAGGELVLDLSSVVKIDAGAVRAMEVLAERAGQASVRVSLSGVNIGIYRALKLLHLAPRFTFV